MNLPNKLTMARIFMAVLVLVILVCPWAQMGIEWPEFTAAGRIVVNLRYIICGIIFIIAAFTDFLDGSIARKNNLVTDFGKTMDAIADKILVNGLLIVLANDGFISIIIPVVIITRDIIVDSVKMVSSSKGKVVAASSLGKIKTACMMIGMALVLFYNLPFELLNINLGNVLIAIATVLSVVSGCQYYLVNKELFAEK